ncbi:[Fe-Fe] hydrogenase large subunit C-terminal domain-containing protein [Christensenella hongkongensis]|uniref:[Fe-Fe] hydrogenase large subunit C-terminal domain-containing protein n=1 Tax=Christensenella hongkongensis TaxID=270498 RepID=UPI002670DEA1|nr:[Fe-Fe] hydrogenase large subunit C-terminal domain-containing protein [Christensenella hongkongensis]
MAEFKKIYDRLFRASIQGKTEEEIKKIKEENENLEELDCLLHPGDYPVVWKFGSCDCPPEKQKGCADNCEFDAIVQDEKGGVRIDASGCVGCASCIDFCDDKKLQASKDILPALEAVRNGSGPAYALVAPAFLGQFSNAVTPGKLREAFKAIGFDGMIEVALFADILTLKEALEFDKNIVKESDYQLTSCCCPMWIAMIRKIYRELMPHVPGSVSPMIACGRTIKQLHPDAVTVFIGPCIAKKSEAREKDLAGAIDYVLTFQEVRDIFEATKIDPEQMRESDKDHSSRAGRIYARTGGVSEAVRETVERLSPAREITPRTQHADGVPACKAMINDLLAGKTTANFFEGMGCVGGCVGGPKAVIDREQGRKNVDEYGRAATYPTPIDNPYVIELLHRLGFDTVESLLEHSDIFTRDF